MLQNSMLSRSIAAVVLLFIAQATIVSQHTRTARIDIFVKAKHKYHNFNGNVLVAENGRVVYQRSIGFADLRSRRALNSESVFNIASISKQFTAAAIMLCRERGLLSLDDPLSKYLPEVPYDGINLRQMLTHTSGLPEQNELMYKYWTSADPVTNRDMLEYLIKYKPPIAFKPGESFKYCNTNYSLLALVVEKVSGQTFQQFVTENIFAPLKLKHTRFPNPKPGNYKTIPNQTENYIFDHETKQLLPPEEIPQWKKAVPVTGLVGAGNIHSTTGDLLKWQESLNNATILKRESIREMETPHVEANVDGSDAYGYGLAIKSIYDDTKIFHYGGTLGYWNSLQHFKRTNRTIIVLTNNESEKGLTNAIGAILFNQPVVLPSLHKETSLSPAQLNKFVGTYQAANGSSFSIENKNGKLFRVVANAPPRELKAASPSKLFYDDETDRQIEFVFDKRGVKVRFISQGLVTELKKAQ
ncbi:MAG TPA: serine hydrolase domain-containing protein [Pyrinomonadaceae bacterium]|nr:serine hydrolase domain-containing protein [Pyrinomonadaceae bacterium]